VTTLYSNSHLFIRKSNPTNTTNPIELTNPSDPKCCHGAKVGYCHI